MHLKFVAMSAIVLAMDVSKADAYKLGGSGGTCPKDPKVQCEVYCANGQVADYMKWNGSVWSDLTGQTKDPDMNGEAKKIIANSNKQNAMMGGAPDCR